MTWDPLCPPPSSINKYVNYIYRFVQKKLFYAFINIIHKFIIHFKNAGYIQIDVNDYLLSISNYDSEREREIPKSVFNRNNSNYPGQYYVTVSSFIPRELPKISFFFHIYAIS